MSFLAPSFLALLALAIPILLLWMLKLRRREVTVSSTMLWNRLIRDREANAPWQKIRRNLLLFLQLIILLALAVALARPYLSVPSAAGKTIVLLLDASASMNAVDVEPSRFEVARRAADQVVDNLSSDGVMTVIAVGYQPRILASAANDKSILRQAIAAAQPEQAPADWPAALALAAGAVRGAAGASDSNNASAIIIISDGVGLSGAVGLPSLPGKVQYIPIGQEGGAQNLAITALALRQDTRGPSLFINIDNTGPRTFSSPDSPLEPLISIYLDGELVDSRRIDAPSGKSLPLIFSDLDPNASVVEARLQVNDGLALDNTAWALVRTRERKRVLVVSEGNLFLERAIASMPGVDAFQIGPTDSLPAEAFDLYVLDGSMPETAPAAPLLVLNPPPGNPLLSVTGTFSDTRITYVSDDSLLSHVDLSQVQIMEAQSINQPSWPRFKELVRARGGSLLFTGEPQGWRVAVLTFDLHKSDLPLQVAFPVLISNLVEWLTPGLPFDVADKFQPGDALTLYPGDAQTMHIIQPDGAEVDILSTSPEGESHLIYAGAEQLGLYQVMIDGELAGQFAVNLFDPAESAISRQETLTIGPAEIAPEQEQDLGQKELWPWLAGLALLVILIEWWVYHRSTLVPARRSNSRSARPL
ncbi:MAG: VWA domain-containing protein [Anaerolineales bacterium]|nr:VWA domain-containing protein [Anaerolineales bacterium]